MPGYSSLACSDPYLTPTPRERLIGFQEEGLWVLTCSSHYPECSLTVITTHCELCTNCASCLYMYGCVCVFVCEHTCAWVYGYLKWTHVCACMGVRAYIDTCVDVGWCMHIYTHVYMCVCKHMYGYVDRQTCRYVQIWIITWMLSFWIFPDKLWWFRGNSILLFLVIFFFLPSLICATCT